MDLPKNTATEYVIRHFSWHFSWFFIDFTDNKSMSRYENYKDEMFHNFYRVCYNIWTIYDGFFIFSNYIGEVDQFTIDLLRRPDT